mgnify:CR=1 FL=1
MPEIRVLPKNIADLIAAGEVVERPASVIKELLENSIDAGATSVTVEIMNGGTSYMRVTDNGCGISEKDVATAFVSHATSKIKTVDDLDSIYTLGFRGEALASVSAVAKVDVLTKTPESDIGVHYCIEGGKELVLEEAGCPDGTTIVVSDIFFNTPARMKFLKKDVSEANAVSSVVDRIALSHPEVSIRFIRDGKQAMLTNGNGDLLSTVYSVLGKEVSDSLISVDYEIDNVRVSGYISRPVSCRATRGMQFCFLNSRFIKSTTVMAALEQSYKNSVMVGKFPACVLNIEVNAKDVDVNVHPAKTEVRFSDDRRIFNAVYYACLNALNNQDTRVQADLTRSVQKAQRAQPAVPQYSQIKMEAKPKKDFWQNLTGEEFKSVASRLEDSGKVKISSNENDGEDLLRDFYRKKNEKQTHITDNSVEHMAFDAATAEKAEVKSDNAEVIPEEKDIKAVDNTDTVIFTDSDKVKPEVRVIGEAFKTYIFAQIDNKLVIVDKHAAHERMIFNKLKKNEIPSQYLFAPVTVSLSKAEYSAVLENLDLLRKAGYTVEDFGLGSVVVRECPCEIKSGDIPSQITEIAGYLVEDKNDIETEKIEWIYHSAACRAAIKAGDYTTPYEQQKFVEMLLEDESIRYCPHGRPVLIEMTKSELEKQFGRIQ